MNKTIKLTREEVFELTKALPNSWSCENKDLNSAIKKIWELELEFQK